MKHFIYSLCIILVFAACSSNGGKPKNFLPQEKMKLVLFDVLVAQEYATTKYGTDTNAVNANTMVMMQQVFNIHQINKDDFYNSFKYYEDHPDENKELFDSISAYANQQRQNIYQQLR